MSANTVMAKENKQFFIKLHLKGQGPTIKAKGSEKWPVCSLVHIQ